MDIRRLSSPEKETSEESSSTSPKASEESERRDVYDDDYDAQEKPIDKSPGERWRSPVHSQWRIDGMRNAFQTVVS